MSCASIELFSTSPKEGHYFAVVDEAPFSLLDITNVVKDGSHRVTVGSVVELVQIQVVKHPKEVEQGRNKTSCSWDGDDPGNPFDDPLKNIEG